MNSFNKSNKMQISIRNQKKVDTSRKRKRNKEFILKKEMQCDLKYILNMMNCPKKETYVLKGFCEVQETKK